MQHSLNAITTDGRKALDSSEYVTKYDPPNYGEPDPHLIEACPRVPVAKCPARLPQKWTEALEHNQLIRACCRHPEHHEVGAYFSSKEDQVKGIPDVYIFFCTCGRLHRRFVVGGSKNPQKELTHPRPYWEIR